MIRIHAKYKNFIYTVLIGFILGYIVAGLQGRGQSHDLRVRAESVIEDNKRLREQLQTSQKQLANLKATIGAAGKTASDAAKSTNDIEKSNQEIRESVESAIREIESSGDGFKDARRIFSEIQKRGGSKE
jgi:methyl-accepting chemotaxis protein